MKEYAQINGRMTSLVASFSVHAPILVTRPASTLGKIASLHLTEATTSLVAIQAGPAHAAVAFQIVDTSDMSYFSPVLVVG